VQFWNKKQKEPDNGLLGACIYPFLWKVHTVCTMYLHIMIKQHLKVQEVSTLTHTCVEGKISFFSRIGVKYTDCYLQFW